MNSTGSVMERTGVTEQLLTTEQVANWLGFDEATVRRLVKRNQLAA